MAVIITAGPFTGETGTLEPMPVPKPRVMILLDDGRRVPVNPGEYEEAP